MKFMGLGILALLMGCTALEPQGPPNPALIALGNQISAQSQPAYVPPPVPVMQRTNCRYNPIYKSVQCMSY